MAVTISAGYGPDDPPHRHTVVAHHLPHVGDPQVCGCREAAPLTQRDIGRARTAAGLLRDGLPAAAVYRLIRDQIERTGGPRW